MGPSSEGPVVDACAKCGRVHPVVPRTRPGLKFCARAVVLR